MAINFTTTDSEFHGEEFSLSPEDFDELYPYDYLVKFCSPYITNLIVGQTNLFSVQKSGRSITTNKDEMERFLGVQMLMGLVKLPNYHYYWKRETRYSTFADLISANRYKTSRRYIHFVDNEQQDKTVNDKLFRIRPILQLVRDKTA